MKKQVFSLVLFTFVSSALSAPSSSAINPATGAANVRNAGPALSDAKASFLATPKKNIITITLKANKTTGFMWFLSHYDSKLIQPVSYNYLAPKNTSLIGASGYSIWQFRVKKRAFLVPQQTRVALTYIKPWEAKKGTTLTFTINTVGTTQ